MWQPATARRTSRRWRRRSERRMSPRSGPARWRTSQAWIAQQAGDVSEKAAKAVDVFDAWRLTETAEEFLEAQRCAARFFCAARVWGDGWGGQCGRPALPGIDYCESHQSQLKRHLAGYLTHGRIDGPVPPKKQREFELAQARLKRKASEAGCGPVAANGAGAEPTPAEVGVRFQPSMLGECRALLVISGPGGGEYKALLTGFAQPPQPQGPITIMNGKQGVVEFRNPFDKATDFSLQVDNPTFMVPMRTQRIDPQKSVNISVNFKSDRPQGGRLIISCDKVSTPWIFFLKGE
ncbi:unnamed protein product [Effrenium voratum]|nr:unnamed protein product [Effrenium voratum]